VSGEEVLGGSGTARQRLRQAELELKRRVVGVRRGLLERSPEVGDGALRRALGEGAARCRAEGLGDPRLSTAGDREQLGCDLLRRGPGFATQPSRAVVHELALAWGKVVVDGAADQPVGERERKVGHQDLRPNQLSGRLGRCLLLDPGERGDRGQVRPVTQHRGRPGDVLGLAREPGEPQEHRARDGARAELADEVGARGGRVDPFRLQRPQEFPHEQRVTAGRRMAGVGEALLVLAEALAEDRRHGGSAQGPGTHEPGDRLVRDLADHRGVGARFGRPQGDRD
jgi:hypothetical protein